MLYNEGYCTSVGEHVEGRTYVVFRFRIRDRDFCWHQPRELVTWPIKLTEAPETVDLEHDPKPVDAARLDLDAAKKLLGWILAEAGAEKRCGEYGGMT